MNDPAIKHRVPGLAQEFVWIGCIFCLAIFTTVWLGFILDASRPVDSAFPIAAIVVTILAAARSFANGGVTATALAAVLAAALVFVCVIAHGAFYDTSYDGMAYHLVSVIALLRGWNPLRAEHVVDWLTSGANLQEAGFIRAIAGGGVWTDYYPKASWIMGASAAAMSGTIASADWVQPFLCVVSGVAAHRFLRLHGLRNLTAAMAAGALALSPVVAAQLASSYVDGLVGSALLIEVAGLGAWLLRKSRADLVIGCAGFILAANFKYTGLVYAGIYAVAVLGYALARGRAGRNDTRAILAAGAIIVVFCIPTYGLNILRTGHPFHPLERMDIIHGIMPDEFLAQDRLSKFADMHLRPLFDRETLASLDAFKAGTTPEIRIAGFGAFFALFLIASLAGTAWRFWRPAAGGRYGDGIFPVLIAATLVSTLVNPEFWWARFVPQLWFAPILAGVWLVLRGSRVAGLGIVSIAVLLALPPAALSLRSILREAREQQHYLVSFDDGGTIIVQDGVNENYGLFVMNQIAKEQGATLSGSGPRQELCARRFGIVRICEPGDPG